MHSFCWRNNNPFHCSLNLERLLDFEKKNKHTNLLVWGKEGPLNWIEVLIMAFKKLFSVSKWFLREKEWYWFLSFLRMNMKENFTKNILYDNTRNLPKTHFMKRTPFSDIWWEGKKIHDQKRQKWKPMKNHRYS